MVRMRKIYGKMARINERKQCSASRIFSLFGSMSRNVQPIECLTSQANAAMKNEPTIAQKNSRKKQNNKQRKSKC